MMKKIDRLAALEHLKFCFRVKMKFYYRGCEFQCVSSMDCHWDVCRGIKRLRSDGRKSY